MTDLDTIRRREQQQARALADTRRERKRAVKAVQPRKVKAERVRPMGRGQRQPRAEDPAYLAWLHEGLPCVACVAEYAPTASIAPVEAAHQKFNLARPGWTKFTGKRVHDRQCLPLCPWHHQHAPNACDKAQAKFWNRLGFTLDQVADLCGELYATFKAGGDGEAVLRRHAEAARKATP